MSNEYEAVDAILAAGHWKPHAEYGVQWADGYVDGPFDTREECMEGYEPGDGDVIVTRAAPGPWAVTA